jgi:predicted DNA-binding protein
MNKYDDAAAMLAAPITDEALADAEVDRAPRKSSTLLSVRMATSLAERLFAEADRRGMPPSTLARELIEASLDDTERAPVVNLADVHRAIDSVAKSA